MDAGRKILKLETKDAIELLGALRSLVTVCSRVVEAEGYPSSVWHNSFVDSHEGAKALLKKFNKKRLGCAI